jgi:hypothetical protein
VLRYRRPDAAFFVPARRDAELPEFFLGDIDDPVLRQPCELFAAVVVNLIATALELGDHTQMTGPCTSRQPRRRPAAHRRRIDVRLRLQGDDDDPVGPVVLMWLRTALKSAPTVDTAGRVPLSSKLGIKQQPLTPGR